MYRVDMELAIHEMCKNMKDHEDLIEGFNVFLGHKGYWLKCNKADSGELKVTICKPSKEKKVQVVVL